MLEPAHKFRRVVAALIDFLLTIAISHVVMGLVGLVLPLDKPITMGTSLAFGLAVGFTYLGGARPLLGNSLGKWLFSIEVVSEDALPLGWGRSLLRLLCLGLWPINGVMVFFAQRSRHLGDRLARTQVVAHAKQRGLLVGLFGGVAVGIVAIQLSGFMMQLALSRTEAWSEARLKLARAQSESVSLLPDGAVIVNDEAIFDQALPGGTFRIHLRRASSGWRVEDISPVAVGVRGVSLQFGGMSSSSM